MFTAHDELAALERWLASPRFAGLQRLHGAREVVRRRGAFSYDFTLARNEADRFHTRLRRQFEARDTLGDGAPHAIADFAAKSADPSHAGEFVERAARSGAAAYRIEDSWSDADGAEHSPETRLAPIEPLIRHLAAARLELDAEGIPGVIIAVMDADGQLIPRCNTAPDRAFLIGATNLGVPSFQAASYALVQWLDRAAHAGAPSAARASSRNGSASGALSAAEIADAEAWLVTSGAVQLDTNGHRTSRAEESPFERLRAVWRREAGAKTFGEAVVELMCWPPPEGDHLGLSPADWRELAQHASFEELRERADLMGICPAWDAGLAQSLSGDLQVRSGVDLAIARALAAAPHADLLSLKTRTADLGEARRFANAIHAHAPGKLLGYELDANAAPAEFSPTLVSELSRLGFVLQAIRRRALQDQNRVATAISAIATEGN